MDKSSEGGEVDTHQLSQIKPQRYSKRLVNLMSGACSVTHAQSSTASAGSTVVHEDDIVTHHHHKLRSHKRLSSSSSSSKNTNNNSRKSTGLRNPSTDCESSIQASNEHHQPENQGVGDEECCELEIINEKRKGKADGRDCCGGAQAAGGSDSSLLKSIISSSSCLPPTNETNELSQQAGLGGPTKRCKRTTATTTTASSCSNNNSPLVTVSPSQKDDDDEHHHDVVDDDETAAAAHVGCASRASTQLSNDNGCIVETRSESQSDNEMYQEDDDEVGPSCELPRKPSTSLSTTLIQSSPSSQLSVGLNLLNSTGTSYKDDGSEKEKESGVGNNNGDHATFHEKNSSPPNYYHVAGLKIGGGVSVRENTQKKGCDGEPIVKVKHCDEAQEQKRTDAGDGVERRKNASIAQDEQEDLDVTKAKLQPPMSFIGSVVMPELQIDGGYDDKPLSAAAAASLSNSKQQHLHSPSGVHSNSKKSSRAKKASQSHQTNSKQSNRRGVGGLGSVHDTIPISSSSPSCSSVVLRSKVQVENNNNNNCNTRGGASGFSDNSSNSKQSVVEPKKPNIAPMLLMNNLPYMGELTFDTRPRRGRKPKKADICHLISKNYGIQFPVSYINLPNTGTGAQNLPHPVPQPLPPSSSSSTSKSSSHHHKRNHASSTSIPSLSVPILSTPVSASPSSSQMLPPPAFSNRDVSIVPIPSNWRGGSLDKPCSPQVSSPSTCSSGSSGGGMKPLSLAQQLMLHPASAQQAISMFPLPSLPHNQSCHQGKMMSVVQVKEELNDEDGEEEQGGGGGEQGRPENLKMETSSSWDSDDTPLNLCLRDSSSMHDTEPLSLCKGDEVVDDDEYDEQDGVSLIVWM